jgi:hypothetical protein
MAAQLLFAAERCDARLERGDAFGGYSAYAREALASDSAAVASMVVLSSFSPEWAVSIERIKGEGDRWLARYSVAKKQIWGSNDSLRPQVDVHVLRLDSGLAYQIVETWRRMVANPALTSLDAHGLDGDTYVFSVAGQRVNTWSPQCGVPQIAVRSALALRDAVMRQRIGDRKRELQKLSEALDSISQQLPASRPGSNEEVSR